MGISTLQNIYNVNPALMLDKQEEQCGGQVGRVYLLSPYFLVFNIIIIIIIITDTGSESEA